MRDRATQGCDLSSIGALADSLGLYYLEILGCRCFNFYGQSNTYFIESDLTIRRFENPR
jgi:hypothetical protein